jgi:hypothetical protein
MSPPDRFEDGPDAAAGEAGMPVRQRGEPPAPPRYGRYVGLLAVLILVLIAINTIVTKPNGGSGFAPGEKIAPFAVPLALSALKGDANVATRTDEGSAGHVPACQVRKASVLNVCQLYEHAPLVLALFVNGGACPGVLSDLQSLRQSFPAVRFAAVAIKGDRAKLRRLVRARGLSFPVGIDSDGALVVLYKDATCPQVSFVLPGGEMQSDALLRRVPLASLRVRVERLVAAARTRGWSPAAR